MPNAASPDGSRPAVVVAKMETHKGSRGQGGREGVENRRAAEPSEKSRGFIVVGSTPPAPPAAMMPACAKGAGAFPGIVNLFQTPYDDQADVRITEKAGEVLPALVRVARRLKRERKAGPSRPVALP